jgi:hypothetical protein
MKKYKDNVELGIFGIGVFLFLTIFFVKIHPMIIFDTDDWLYIYYQRRALPLWGNWNPIKVFPETLMSLFSQIGAVLFYPRLGSYIDALTLIHGLVVSVFIFVYVLEFVLLIRDRFHAGIERSIVIGCLFLLFHFLIFRKFYEENGHLLFSSNVTCYYNYLLPNVFNCTLVMQFMRTDVVKDWWKPTDLIKKGLTVLLVYFAIFSNLFSSVILTAYVGTMLLWELVSQCKAYRFRLTAYIRQNGVRLIVVLAWLVSQIFEMNGGRADTVGGGSLLSGIVTTLKALWQWIHRINYSFAFLTLAVLVLYVIAVVQNRKSKTQKAYLSDIGKLLLSMALTTIYLVLLCAKSAPSYISRYDEILAIAFWGLLILGICVNYVLEQYKNLMMLVPLLTVILFCETNTSGNTFKDVNFTGLPYEVCVAIDEDIVNQFVEADQSGATELTVYVPDFGSSDNWPIATYAGERFAEALSKHGVTSKTMYVKEVIPSTEKNEQFHLEY